MSLVTGELPAQIVAADLTGDGFDDLVVRNAGSGTLSIFINNDFNGAAVTPGAPLFDPPVILTVGTGVSDVAAIDTTGSGMLDLVVTSA